MELMFWYAYCSKNIEIILQLLEELIKVHHKTLHKHGATCFGMLIVKIYMIVGFA